LADVTGTKAGVILTRNGFSRIGTPALVIIVAVAVRLFVAQPAHNFDFDSYRIVANIMDRGGNVYAETSRYNYGPIWFWVLHALDSLSHWFADPLRAFRLSLAVFLTLVDLGLFAVIWRRHGRLAATATLLSPVAILITGFHGQFDNFALLLGMVAVSLYESDDHRVPGPSGITSTRFAAFMMLGISLMVKHILFLFPVWLALRERGWRARAWAFGLPVAVFLSGFLPYLREGRAGIIANVFQYRSFANAPLWNAVLPSFVRELIAPVPLFLAALLVAGYVTRRRRAMDALLLYTLVLVCFAPAMTNQYLAIVVPAIAVFTNIPFMLYSLVATLLLISSDSGLLPQARVLLPGSIGERIVGTRSFELPIEILFAGLLWLALGARVTDWIARRRGTPQAVALRPSPERDVDAS
jgi:hypothetical protein